MSSLENRLKSLASEAFKDAIDAVKNEFDAQLAAIRQDVEDFKRNAASSAHNILSGDAGKENEQ